MAKWTAEQRRKFKATMQAKADKRAAPPETTELPLDAIPARHRSNGNGHGKRGNGKHINGVLRMHAEVDARTGEMTLVLGVLRVPLRVR